MNFLLLFFFHLAFDFHLQYFKVRTTVIGTLQLLRGLGNKKQYSMCYHYE